MNRKATLIATMAICLLPSMQTRAKSADKAGAPSIAVTKLEVSDRTLELNYQTRNDSDDDIWICEYVNLGDYDFEALLAEDARTLLVRRRLDVALSPSISRTPLGGRYVLLEAGRKRSESLSLPLPVSFRSVFMGSRAAQGIQYPTRLAIEIGYYDGDVSRMIYDVVKEYEEADASESYGILRTLNAWQESLRQRSQQVLREWTGQALEGEGVLKIAVDGVRIPYLSEKKQVEPPDLRRCTRLKIQYQPSMLEYFYPYAEQQGLLSPSERQYLDSLKIITIDSPKDIKAFARDIYKGMDGGIITEGSAALVTCYRDDTRLTSLTIYDDTYMETDKDGRFVYWNGVPSMRTLAPQMQRFELRIECAANLVNIWHRLLLYRTGEDRYLKNLPGVRETIYPMPTEWADALVRTYDIAGIYEGVRGPFKCAGAGEDKSHYAMNPNCKPDSPADTVLLFETKGGWNQHGGPELFTFDNHDPKGGCVLLNDGTVKFIRTKEELQQLRWK